MIKVTGCSLLVMSQTSSWRRAKQLALFTFSRVTFLITCSRMRSILHVAPADVWLKNFMSESPRSSVISRGAVIFYSPPPLSQANITREMLNGLHHPWAGLFVQFPYGIQKLFISSLLLLQVCVVVSLYLIEDSLLNLLALFCKLILSFLHITQNFPTLSSYRSQKYNMTELDLGALMIKAILLGAAAFNLLQFLGA